MTEDEAFIRAIVDKPGDDTPRLVYADWLDERGDPRGPYLRAEHEWAATHDPGERESLWKMAHSLSPVWIARVSRPPVGICCDHVRFQNRGPELTEAAVAEAESQLGVRLPYQFQALLLNYNGGEPSPSGFVPGWLEPTRSDDLDNHFEVGPLTRINPGHSLDLVVAARACWDVGAPHTSLFLALVPDDSALVVEVARGSGRGRVFYWENAVSTYDGDAVSFQAASIADLLATITHPPTPSE